MNQPITAQDLLLLNQPSDAQLSPSGNLVAFVLRTRDWETNSSRHQIWIVETATGEGSFVSPEDETCASPRWSPDGQTLAWLNHSKGNCTLQLFSAGMPKPCIHDEIDLPAGTHHIAWSPDGESLAFLAPAVFPTQSDKGIREVGRDNPMVDLCLLRLSTRTWSRLTDGQFSVTTYDWHPSLDQLAVCATPSSRPEHWDRGDVWIVSVNEPEATELVKKRCTRAIWSPDGGQIAVIRLGERSFLDTPTVEIHNLEGGVTSHDPFDEEAQLLAWTTEGILALSVEGCSSHLFWLDPASGSTRRVMPEAPDGFSLIEGWFGQGCARSKDGRQLAFTSFDALHPGEIATVDLDSGELTYITQAMESYQTWGLPTPEIFTWNASDGTPLSGVLIRPDSDGESGPHPLIIALHGGPTAMASQAPFADNDWIWAAIPMMVQRGAMVLLPDYRGSIGYGSRFRQMNEHKIGLANLDDIQSAINTLSAKGWVDTHRVGAVGASHGGYLAALLATATDCLAAAICRSGITDWALNYALNQNPDWERQYFGGTPWEQPDRYRAASPISYVGRASTPVLFIHGDQDRQAPTANAYALHRGLKDHDIPSRLVILEGVGHGGGSLVQLEYGVNLTVKWFEQWLKLA